MSYFSTRGRGGGGRGGSLYEPIPGDDQSFDDDDDVLSSDFGPSSRRFGDSSGYGDKSHRRSGVFGEPEREGTPWEKRMSWESTASPRAPAADGRDIRSAEDEEALAGDKHLGGKTIGWISSIVLYINNIHGTGVLAVPIIFQQAGWLVPMLMLFTMALVATFSGTLICEAMSLIPGNDNFQRRVEFSSCVKYYFTRRWYIASQVLFNACLQVQIVAGIIVSASVMDEFFVFLFHKSYAIEYYPQLRIVELTSATEPYEGFGALVSLGFIASFALCAPLGMVNLEEQMGVQWASFLFMIAIHTEFFWQMISVDTFSYDQIPVWGRDYSRVLGVIIFSFAHVITLPSWACEKKPDVSVTTTVWTATWFNFFLYAATGILGALAYPHMKTADFLVILAMPHSPLITKIGVILFSLTAILPGLPVHTTIVRYNLYTSGVSHKWSAFWGNFFPWLFALWVYHSHNFSLILNWGALLASGTVSFIIPLGLFIKARSVTAGLVDRASHYHGVPRNCHLSSISVAFLCLIITSVTIIFAVSYDIYLLVTTGQSVVAEGG